MKKLLLLTVAGLFISNGLLEAGCPGGVCSRRVRTAAPVLAAQHKKNQQKKLVTKAVAKKKVAVYGPQNLGANKNPGKRSRCSNGMCSR